MRPSPSRAGVVGARGGVGGHGDQAVQGDRHAAAWVRDRRHDHLAARREPESADGAVEGGGAGVDLGFGRIVASEKETPNMLVNMV
jgi:hypothetical protein